VFDVFQLLLTVTRLIYSSSL